MRLDSTTGRTSRAARLAACGGRIALSVFFLAIGATCVSAGDAPLPITASSIHSAEYQTVYALDGDLKTRWASGLGRGKPEWLQLDFAITTEINLGLRRQIKTQATGGWPCCAAHNRFNKTGHISTNNAPAAATSPNP